jgi:uncharacterized protein YjiS (DUF1127 family)
MTTITFATHAGQGLLRSAGRALSTLTQPFRALFETIERAEEMRRLSELSDAKLAAMGLSRCDIPAHVFGERT